MRYLVWVLCVLTLLSAAPLSAQESPALATQPPRGTFVMRPELVGTHPRLFFTADDLPALRRRAAGAAKFFVDRARECYGMYLGQAMPDPPEGWKRYLYGNWALVSFDLMAVTTDDARAAATARQWALALCEQDWWVRDDLSPMDTLTGLAITYDVLYDRFTDAERAKLRGAIHQGLTFIAERFFVPSYWTRDYQNNHCHNRICALATAAFAIYGDDPALDVQPQADLAIQQVRNVLAWLPEDGSQHEGPGYWSFGHHWLVRAVHVAEHTTGEDLTAGNAHMTNAHRFRLYMTAPGWNHTLNIGDGGAGRLQNPTAMIRPAVEARDGHTLALLRHFMDHGEFRDT